MAGNEFGVTGGPRTNGSFPRDRSHSNSKRNLGNPRTVQTPIIYVMGQVGSIMESDESQKEVLRESSPREY